ncbi:MAG: hypothetical protein JWR24_1104 [Actinoallomurus sp.]|nr:hypothetical protein [Actinoallomurus sp.]
MTGQRSRALRLARLGAYVLVPLLVGGCSGGDGGKDSPGQVRAACERYVKDRLKSPSAKFAGEKVTIGAVRTRATMGGMVDSVPSSPSPVVLPMVRYTFRCSVERQHGRWDLVVLTGLDG